MAKWIWRFGDFEMYHSLLVHNRRREYDTPVPVIWKLYAPEPVVRFEKLLNTSGGEIRVSACGNYVVNIFGKSWNGTLKFGMGQKITVPEGKMKIQIRVSNPVTLPCVFVEGAAESDETWLCDDVSGNFCPVGSWDALNAAEQTPERFPFAYNPEPWVSAEETGRGRLFDFGKETFCCVTVSGLSEKNTAVRFGESKEEAMDAQWCTVRYCDKPENGCLQYQPTAFRYVYVGDKNAAIQADYESLPLKTRGSFSSGDETVDWVWNTAARTFRLNSREFFLDGIKRDRWVWSGDAYQSFFVNRYLFMDQEIEKRTLIALGGKKPFIQHINTIMDYTFFWLIALYDHYRTYGDIHFLRNIFPQAQEVMAFCLRRRSEDGFVRACAGDWVFLDWADIDKEGAVLGEQVLFAKALENYGHMMEVLGTDGAPFLHEAEQLQAKILQRFYDADQQAFIDSYESGRRLVTRHNNILAYLYLPCTPEQRKGIVNNVLMDPDVPEITTPYFKFFENEVYCREGDPERLEKCIREYYGGMKALGATTLFERFDPKEHGAEHLAMYDAPFGRSLCHAWSASPIYLLGRYRMGVENTGIAYDTFTVKPMLGSLPGFEGAVPLPKGEVRIKADAKGVAVTATASGGTLLVGGRKIPLEAGKEIKTDWNGKIKEAE